MTNKDLNWFYSRFNKLFFKSKLPKIPVGQLLKKVSNSRGILGRTRFSLWRKGKKVIPAKPIKIQIAYMDNNHVLQTLLHEMVHVKLGFKYSCRGNKFKNEITRLYRANAFRPLVD